MTETLRFLKGHGTENDFVLIMDEHGAAPLTPGLVRALADRHAGVGGDGVIRAVRAGAAQDPAAGGHPPERWFMDYWNADGSLAEMCGNGARVFGALLEAEAGEDLSGGVVIATRAGERTVTSLGGGRYSVGMGRWRVPGGGDPDATVEAPGLAGPAPGWSVDVGNPHTVVALPDEHAFAAVELSRPPAVSPPPPHGTNVEFVVTLAQAEVAGEDGPRGDARGLLVMRVHERGVGETRSCGTGAVASAVAARLWEGEGAPTVWDVAVPGGVVTVRLHGDEAVLEGPAVLVAEGRVDLARLPH